MAYEADASLFGYFDRIEQIYKELAIINDLKIHNTITNPGTAQALIGVLRIRDADRTQVGVNFVTSLERFAKEEVKYRRASFFVTVLLILGIFLFSAIAIWPMVPGLGVFGFRFGADPLATPAVTDSSTPVSEPPAFAPASTSPRAGISFQEAFPDDVFRLYVLTEVITDERTEADVITDADIEVMAAWTALDVNAMVIADTTGIEYFPAASVPSTSLDEADS